MSDQDASVPPCEICRHSCLRDCCENCKLAEREFWKAAAVTMLITVDETLHSAEDSKVFAGHVAMARADFADAMVAEARKRGRL